MNAPLRSVTSPSPAMEMLLITYPLTRILRGAKKETFMRAWARMALAEARQVLNRQETELPTDPRAVLLSLHAAVLEMGDALDIDRIEFAAQFNARAEDFERGVPAGLSAATERCMATLALFCARRLEREL